MDEANLAAEAARKMRLSSDKDDSSSLSDSYASDSARSSETSGSVTPVAKSAAKGTSMSRGFAGANERTRQLASTKFPPGLQAKLEAVRMNCNTKILI